MQRRLLTKNQTVVLQSLKQELSERSGFEVTITDIFNSCMTETILTTMSERMKKFHERKITERQLEDNRKNLKVYQGSITSNGLLYKAVVAVGNKTDLRCLLDMTLTQLAGWNLTQNSIHIEVAVSNPKKVFAFRPKRGRPSITDFFIAENPKPVHPRGGDVQ